MKTKKPSHQVFWWWQKDDLHVTKKVKTENVCVKVDFLSQNKKINSPFIKRSFDLNRGFVTSSYISLKNSTIFTLLYVSLSKALFCLNLHLLYDRYTTLKNKITELQTKFQKGTLGNRLNKNPVKIYLFKVNNRYTRKRCELCPKLTIKTLELR